MVSLPPLSRPDGRTIATVVPEGTIGLWEAATGRLLRSLPSRMVGPVAFAAFSPDLEDRHHSCQAQSSRALRCPDRTADDAPVVLHRDEVTALSVRSDGKVAAHRRLIRIGLDVGRRNRIGER